MKYNRENLRHGLTPEYVSACKSLDMWLRKQFGGTSYLKGEMSDCRGAYWFRPPTIDDYSGGWTWAGVRRDGNSFGILAWGGKGGNTTYDISAKIPCDKLHWEIKEVVY